jgi:apolipoprotein D and lipocalin family protein
MNWKETMPLLMMITLTGVTVLPATDPPLEVVPHVDLSRYLGTWYEIATIPARFQKGCVAVTATYTLRPDGQITVVNRCRKFTLDGKEKSVRGKAWVVDKSTTAKLRVQFFWPFSGAYWIIELDPEYQYAVVGHPSRKYLWILARQPFINDELYRELLGRISAKGYDTSRIQKTLQPMIQKS